MRGAGGDVLASPSLPWQRVSGSGRRRNGLEVAEEQFPIIVLGDFRRRVVRLLEPTFRLLGIAGDRMCSGKRLVGEAEIEVTYAFHLADRETSARVPQCGLLAAEDGVDTRALPFAANSVHSRADLHPVIRRRMRGVKHLVVL